MWRIGWPNNTSKWQMGFNSAFKGLRHVTAHTYIVNSFQAIPGELKIPYFLNEAQHVSGDTPPIIWSPKPHKQPPALHTWKVVGSAAIGRCQVSYVTWQRPTTARPTNLHGIMQNQRPSAQLQAPDDGRRVARNIDIFINCSWVVTRWQYTFTHKHYIEQHR
jgi:hypothetical protein